MAPNLKRAGVNHILQARHKAFGLFRWEAPNLSMLEVGKGGLPPLLKLGAMSQRG